MTVTDIDVLPNLRDLGGLPAAGGRSTRAGVFYRSALPAPGDARPTAVADCRPGPSSTCAAARVRHPRTPAAVRRHRVPDLS